MQHRSKHLESTAPFSASVRNILNRSDQGYVTLPVEVVPTAWG